LIYSIILLLGGMLVNGPSALRAGEQTEQAFAGEVRLKVGYRYLLALPEGYKADAKETWPLLVFLHGSGERGTDLNLIKKHGPPKLVAEGQRFPGIVASLQCESGQIWDPHGVKAVVDDLIQRHRVDAKRVYLTGLSLGGFGTWDTAMEYPETFAAIVPICGGAGVRWVMAERIKDLPCWIFHGDQDTAVPVEFSTKMHGALTKAGSKAKLTVYPGVGHDCWTQTYADPKLWEWLFAQRRP
jgi:predicted peptidase